MPIGGYLNSGVMASLIPQQPAQQPSGPFGQLSNYADLEKWIMQAGKGAGWNQSKTDTTLDQYGTDFSQQFQNAVGRAPTAEELNQFFSQAVNPVKFTSSGFSGTDPNAIAQQYIPQAFSQQIKDFQTQQAQKQVQDLNTQEQQALKGNIGTIQDAIPGITKNVSESFMDGPGFQALQGTLNNSGMLGAGVTSQAVGKTIGNNINSMISLLISNLIGGATGQMQNNPQMGFNMGQQNYGNYQNLGLGQQQMMNQRNNELSDFNMQAALAEKMAKDAAPGWGEKFGVPLGAATIQGAGSAMGGRGTWICTQMKNEGLLDGHQISALHFHLYRALWKRPFKFLGYVLFGKLLVLLANKVGTSWRVWKPSFYDYPMREPDPLKALDLYEEAFWSLYRNVRVRLAERDYRVA